jgi:triacylglycerol lipase
MAGVRTGRGLGGGRARTRQSGRPLRRPHARAIAALAVALLAAAGVLSVLTARADVPRPFVASGLAAPVAPFGGDPPAATAPDELVVLVHGLGRSEFSMLLLAYSLERSGYEVLNWGYSSICCTVEELGRQLKSELDAVAGRPNGAPRRVHFVGHSLGNIIIRWVVSQDPSAAWGNVVMLAPPNQGSHAADEHARWLAWLLRPLPELVTSEASIARRLAWPSHVPAGVIAGRYDGKVTIEETHLAGESAHVVVPSMHTFIMNRADVRRLTLAFLRDGRFGS